jgi:hypothetical protein
MKIHRLLPVVLALACTACVTHIHPDTTSNPPPREALSTFRHFHLQPVAADTAQVREQDAAMAKISANVQQKLASTLATWENREPGGRTLNIEPHVSELKFVSGGKRFFAGAFAGSSAVVMHLRLTDADTGELIAEPEFFQRAAASGGAWSIGGTDNGMLVRIATAAQQYMARNYDHAVGGPTGLDGTEEQ